MLDRLSKKLRESSGGPQPFRASIVSGCVYAGHAAISSEGSLPPGKKLLPCSFRARKHEVFQRKLVGVAAAEELAPPSASLSKFFDKLQYILELPNQIGLTEINSDICAWAET